MNNILLQKAKDYMDMLCKKILNRAVGSQGNVAATNFFKKTISAFEWDITEDRLDVMDWEPGLANITIDNKVVKVESSPYSKGCEVKGELSCVSTIRELEKTNLHEKIVLLCGEIAREQLMPKNFIFYNPDSHSKIISLLETNNPACIISATGRNSALAGGAYPFPLIEDGDFEIPSVYTTDAEGEHLKKYIGKSVTVRSTAKRITAKAYNVSAIKKGGSKRIVITAHIDTKKGTPGALDNASGITILILLTELLSQYSGKYTLEIVAFNGEDYYAVPGQMNFIKRNEKKFDEIILNINIDGQGYIEGKTAFSPNGLPNNIANALINTTSKNKGATIGPWWPQGDHSIFVQYGVPSIAVSSMWLIDNMENQTITHTPSDDLSVVDIKKILHAAEMIAEFINKIP